MYQPPEHSKDVIERARRIRMVVFDVDGVLTDGTLFLSDDGQEHKAFNSRDGLGMILFQRAGLQIGAITARESEVVRRYMESRNVEHLYQGEKDKRKALDDLLRKTSLDAAQVAFLGDDFIDLPCITRVGLGVAVADAHHIVKQNAHWVTPSNGGRGAARELCELILHCQRKLAPLIHDYLK